MQKLTLLILLSVMLMTACVTRNPNKAKNKIADMVELNPGLANFQSDTLIQSTTRRTIIDVPGDIRDKDVKEKVDSQLTGLTDKEKNKVFKQIRKAQKNGKSSSTKLGEKLLKVEGKAEGGVKTTIETPVKGLVVNKYTVQPPQVKKKPWYQPFINASIIAFIVMLFLIILWVKRKTEKK